MNHKHYELVIWDEIEGEFPYRETEFAAARDLTQILDLVFYLVRDERLDPGMFYTDLPTVKCRIFNISVYDGLVSLMLPYMSITLTPHPGEYRRRR